MKCCRPWSALVKARHSAPTCAAVLRRICKYIEPEEQGEWQRHRDRKNHHERSRHHRSGQVQHQPKTAQGSYMGLSGWLAGWLAGWQQAWLEQACYIVLQSSILHLYTYPPTYVHTYIHTYIHTLTDLKPPLYITGSYLNLHIFSRKKVYSKRKRNTYIHNYH